MAFLLPRHRGASAPLGPRPPPPAFRPGNRPGARPLRPVLCLPLPLAGTMRRHWENPRLSSLREGQLIAASIPPVTSGLLGQEAQAVTGPGWDAGILGAVCPAHAPLAEALSPPGADSGAALRPRALSVTRPRPLPHPGSSSFPARDAAAQRHALRPFQNVPLFPEPRPGSPGLSLRVWESCAWRMTHTHASALHGETQRPASAAPAPRAPASAAPAPPPHTLRPVVPHVLRIALSIWRRVFSPDDLPTPRDNPIT